MADLNQQAICQTYGETVGQQLSFSTLVNISHFPTNTEGKTLLDRPHPLKNFFDQIEFRIGVANTRETILLSKTTNSFAVYSMPG